jgi:hypothetical protein
MAFGDSLIEVNLMIKELGLETFLMTHHGNAPFTKFAILIPYMMNLYNNYLSNSPSRADPQLHESSHSFRISKRSPPVTNIIPPNRMSNTHAGNSQRGQRSKCISPEPGSLVLRRNSFFANKNPPTPNNIKATPQSC